LKPLLVLESKRQKQVAKLVLGAISDIFREHGRELYKDAFLTIPEVAMTADLSVARVYLSFYKQDNKEDLLEIIKANTKEIRNLLGRQIKRHVRIIPQLEFYLDNTLDNVDKLEKILKGQKGDSPLEESKDS